MLHRLMYNGSHASWMTLLLKRYMSLWVTHLQEDCTISCTFTPYIGFHYDNLIRACLEEGRFLDPTKKGKFWPGGGLRILLGLEEENYMYFE